MSSEPQFLSGTMPKQVVNLIDEQYHAPYGTDNNLEEIVHGEMRAQGLDPLNRDDVKAFWRSKGLEE